MYSYAPQRHFAAATLGLILSLQLVSTANAEVVLGVMGDSMSDEYSDWASFGTYASNWVEQLSKYGGVQVGPLAADAGKATWGQPRNKGFEYDWAKAGATSDTVLSGGQASGLAAQVPLKGINYAILAIGANDFSPSGAAYQSIYNGTWATLQIDNYVAGRLQNMQNIVNTVLPSGVDLAMTNFVDYGVAPSTVASFSDPLKRDRVTAVIQRVNVGIDKIAAANHIPLIDLFGVAKTVFGPNTNRNSVLTVGNVNINLTQVDTPLGGNPTAAFVHDGVHPSTTLQGLLGNVYMTALNVGFDAGAPIFSELEILAHRGIAYGGSDTVAAQIGDYNHFITNYALPGDANSDGLADGADYTVWADHFLQTGGTWKTGDFTGDGLVDAADYVAWADHLSPALTGRSVTVVPEPSGLVLASVGALLVAWTGRQASSRRRRASALN